MKLHLCALFTLAIVPAILAEGQNSSSLWELIRDKIGHGVGKSPHIGGGVPATAYDFAHQVMLIINPRPGVITYCGRSLISPEWMLTAAHCVIYKKGITAVLGVHDRTAKEDHSRQSIRVSQFHVEPNYMTKDTDIALLKLERPAQLNQFVQPIRLPSLSMRGKELGGTAAEIVGWGSFGDYTGPSAVLRFARTKVITNEVCRWTWGNKITEWRICSDGYELKGACEGDTGGPLIIRENDGKRTIVGVASFSNPSGCQNGHPTVFTRVSSWIEWINKVTNIPLRN